METKDLKKLNDEALENVTGGDLQDNEKKYSTTMDGIVFHVPHIADDITCPNCNKSTNLTTVTHQIGFDSYTEIFCGECGTTFICKG